MMETIILMLLFVGSLSSQAAYSQDVDIRGTNDKVSAEGGGQTRTIYSQKHLSPHRMMHFGKRPSLMQPPTVMTPRIYDLLQQQERLTQQQAAERYPYLLSIELERGQTLQAVPEEQQPNRNLMYTFERPQLEYAINSAEQILQQQQQQQQQQAAGNPLAGQRFLKLISDSNPDSNNDGSNKPSSGELISAERAQPSSNSQDDDGQQLQQPGQRQQAITVSTRSMQSSARANGLNLPKAYISSILYGRQGASSLPNFASYNKKAEPKDNFFMHFGRK